MPLAGVLGRPRPASRNDPCRLVSPSSSTLMRTPQTSTTAGPSRERPISAFKKSSASKGKKKAPGTDSKSRTLIALHPSFIDPDIDEDAPVKKARGRPSKKAVLPEEEDEDATKTTSRKGRKPTATKPTASQKRNKAKAVAGPEIPECDGEPHEEVKSKRKNQKPAMIKPTAAQKKGKGKALKEPEVEECGEVDAEPHEESKSTSRTRKTSKLAVTSLQDTTGQYIY